MDVELPNSTPEHIILLNFLDMGLPKGLSGADPHAVQREILQINSYLGQVASVPGEEVIEDWIQVASRHENGMLTFSLPGDPGKIDWLLDFARSRSSLPAAQIARIEQIAMAALSYTSRVIKEETPFEGARGGREFTDDDLSEDSDLAGDPGKIDW